MKKILLSKYECYIFNLSHCFEEKKKRKKNEQNEIEFRQQKSRQIEKELSMCEK